MNSDDGTDQREKRENESPAYRWGNIPERVVALAAVLALLIYGIQASYMKSANEHTQTQQRAWISIIEPRIEVAPAVGVAMKTAFKIRNLGLTPARVKTYFVRSTPIGRWHGFSRDVDLPPNMSPNPTIVPPGTERELIAYDINHHLTTEEETELATGRAPLMIQFVVTYLDAFDKFRRTVSCFVYSPNNEILSEFGLDDCQIMD